MNEPEINSPSLTDANAVRPGADQGIFPPTRWSLIHRMQCGEHTTRQESLETLCAAYWKPVYAWLRTRGATPADAEDTTQEFFSRLIAGDWLAEVHEDKGRLRAFLLLLLKRHAAREHDHRRALKRGGAISFVPFDPAEAEAAWASQPADGASPDVVFDRQWAMQLLDRVMHGLRDSYEKAGKAALFDELRDYLSGGSVEESYGASAARLGMKESAVKVAAFRLRERYRERLRTEVLDTLDSPDAVDEEIRWLFQVFQ
jgi:DNA-directed RNA polymerase specialized sigma24 family protein